MHMGCRGLQPCPAAIRAGWGEVREYTGEMGPGRRETTTDLGTNVLQRAGDNGPAPTPGLSSGEVVG